jgi:two-component system phosphate regulon sensor histidine kinase PhoR
MQQQRTKIFIIFSSLALVLVLAIQVNWIFKTAQIKEELFNEKANIILARTTEDLKADPETYNNIKNGGGNHEIHKIDSLFKYYMKFYKFYIDYSFEVIQQGDSQPIFLSYQNEIGADQYFKPTEPACYKNSLEKVANTNGMELKLIFPDKKEFILQEMSTMFFASIVLILIVVFLFWHTVLSLFKEKAISEHTADFLNNMTHEFKTPITNISLAGKLIIKENANQNEDKVQHYSEIILEENEKLRLQVEQVLTMTAFERGETPMQKNTLDFHSLIIETLRGIQIQIENKQGQLNLNLEAGKFTINGDKIHLINAIRNLLDNAIKYSNNTPSILIQTSNIDSNLVISIADNGIGIDKKYHEKVFNKFFRVPTGDIHNVKGFGLGLAYVKKIIELHDGKISLSSNLNSGTVFTIQLPYA